MKETTTIGIDLAKSVFQVHGVDMDDTVVLRRQLKRKDVIPFFTDLTSCLIGMEACASAHYWARELRKLGHTVRLMPAKYVKAYVKRGKNDVADAEAICEAVTRPSMREVAVKSVEQQAVLVLHRTRDQLVRQRTQLINALRAHLSEFGIVAAAGHAGLTELCAVIADSDDARLPALVRTTLTIQAAQIASLNKAIAECEAGIRQTVQACETSRRLKTIPGVGTLISSAVVASVGNADMFQSGRSFSAWLGLTPRISGTGGKIHLGSITKQGDRYLRRLLVLGATAVLKMARKNPESYPWAIALLERMSYRQASVAVANKMARIIWAVMVRGGSYRAGHQPAILAAQP